jgi:hypothetical protein
MAVPSISSVSPASGLAWGRDLVRVAGSGFGPGVRITFGGAASEIVNLVGGDDGFADVRTPVCPPQQPGVVSVAVQNLDDDGEPIVGELDTEADAYTYARADTTAESDLARFVRMLLRKLKQQVLDATGMDVAVDFDEDSDDGVRAVVVANPPSLTLAGPRIQTNRFLQRKERRLDVVQGTGGLEFVRRAPSKTVDLAFSLVATTRSKMQLLNIIQCIGQWLNANPRVSMLAVEADPTSERRWPLEHGEFRTSPKGPDDLRTATVDLTVRGFNLDEGRVLDRGRVVEETTVEAEAMEPEEG